MLVFATQSLSDAAAEGDPRFAPKRVRNNLRRHGLDEAALDAECARIISGPSPALLQERNPETRYNVVEYPYGWRKHEMSPLMKRIFHGFGCKRPAPFFHEVWHGPVNGRIQIQVPQQRGQHAGADIGRALVLLAHEEPPTKRADCGANEVQGVDDWHCTSTDTVTLGTQSNA
jgi:hypothetical protein